MSVPADTELAAIFVPSWARAKDVAMKKTPARFAEPPSFKKEESKSRGFQIGSPPKITTEQDDTIMPINEVIPNPRGMVNSCDQKASFGFWAKREKSGTFTINALKFAIEDIIPLTIAQASSLPWMLFGLWITGPAPLALTKLQIKNAIPAAGTTKDFTVNKCLILWTCGYNAGSDNNQKRKNETKSLVLVPELAGIEFGRLWYWGQIAVIISVTHWPPDWT